MILAFACLPACPSACPPARLSAESRSPSFILKGAWRSFTTRKPSQPQLAPSLEQLAGQMVQPPASAQITPRVQPSLLPTPRLAAAPPPMPPLANGSSRVLLPQAVAPVLGAALRAATEAAAAEASAAAGAGAAGGIEAAAYARHQQQQQQQQQQEDEEAGGLPTWRSDAVQLPEQQLLPEGIPTSPSASVETTGSLARVRGR